VSYGSIRHGGPLLAFAMSMTRPTARTERGGIAMNNSKTTRHFHPLTHHRPAQADMSWLDMLMSMVEPTGKSVRIEK